MLSIYLKVLIHWTIDKHPYTQSSGQHPGKNIITPKVKQVYIGYRV